MISWALQLEAAMTLSLLQASEDKKDMLYYIIEFGKRRSEKGGKISVYFKCAFHSLNILK